VEAEALVGASRDEVWELFDDIEGLPRWVPYVTGVAYVSGPARVGTVYRLRSHLFGLPGAEQWEIVEYRRPQIQAHTARTGSMDVTLVVSLERRGTGTWVHERLELRSLLPGPIGFLHELLASIPAGWSIRTAAAGAKHTFEG
jgi:uncharacterized protein YndB with AHSA1/START domain